MQPYKHLLNCWLDVRNGRPFLSTLSTGIDASLRRGIVVRVENECPLVDGLGDRLCPPTVAKLATQKIGFSAGCLGSPGICL